MEMHVFCFGTHFFRYYYFDSGLIVINCKHCEQQHWTKRTSEPASMLQCGSWRTGTHVTHISRYGNMHLMSNIAQYDLIKMCCNSARSISHMSRMLFSAITISCDAFCRNVRICMCVCMRMCCCHCTVKQFYILKKKAHKNGDSTCLTCAI